MLTEGDGENREAVRGECLEIKEIEVKLIVAGFTKWRLIHKS